MGNQAMKRRALLALPLLLLAALTGVRADEANMAGTWELKIVSPQGTRTPMMTLTQDGSALMGTYRGLRGDAPIAGSVHGNAFDLSLKVDGQGGSLVIQYKGTVSGNVLAGRVMMGRMGEADFSGTRVK